MWTWACFGRVDGLGRGEVVEGVRTGEGVSINEGWELNVLFSTATDEPFGQIVRFSIFF